MPPKKLKNKSESNTESNSADPQPINNDKKRQQVVEALRKFLQTLRTLRGLIEGNVNPSSKEEINFTEPVSQKQIETICDLITQSSTKFNILFSNLSDVESSSITQLDEFEQNMMFFVSTYTTLAAANERQLSVSILKQKAKMMFLNVMDSLILLLQAAIKNSKDELLRSTGLVWESCKTLKTLSLNDFLITKEEIEQTQIPIVKDAISELEETFEQFDPNQQNKSKSSEEWEEFDQKISPNLLNSIPHILQLSRLAFTILKKIVDTLNMFAQSESLQQQNRQNQQQQQKIKLVDLLDKLHNVTKDIPELVDDVCCCVYIDDFEADDEDEDENENENKDNRVLQQIELNSSKLAESCVKMIEIQTDLLKTHSTVLSQKEMDLHITFSNLLKQKIESTLNSMRMN